MGSTMQNSTPARRADALANRERIIGAAQALFAERGLDVEITEIAERAGVGVGTLYRHYADRDALLRAIVDKTFDDVFALLQEAVAVEDPVAALRAIPHTAVAIPGRLGPLDGMMHDPRVARLFKDHEQGEMFKRVLNLVGELFDRGVRAGVFRPELDREMVSHALLGTLGTAIKLQRDRRSPQELADTLADFFVAILSKP
jgi:AcrR family transcriptional regulator